MNARITGCGETTLVLAHGYGGSQEMWNKMLPDLTNKYRVLVFDWNFSGSIDQTVTPFDADKYSSLAVYADDLISLIDNMKLRDVVFVGHSMSGMVGCIASVKRPDLFRHLFLICASPRYLNSGEYKGGFERSDIEKMMSDLESNFQVWVENLANHTMGPNGDPASTAEFVCVFQKMKPEVALSVAKTIFFCDHRDILQKVEIPCTIVQGAADAVVPICVADYMRQMIKGKVSVDILESEGHFPQLTDPETLIHIIDRDLIQNKW